MVRVLRKTSCGQLGLPADLACEYCKSSIERGIKKGTCPKLIKSCQQPWHEKWGKHRNIGMVIRHKKIINHLDMNYDGDIIEDEYKYPSTNNNKKSNTENVNKKLNNEFTLSSNYVKSPSLATPPPHEESQTKTPPTNTNTPEPLTSVHDEEASPRHEPNVNSGEGVSVDCSKIKYINQEGSSNTIPFSVGVPKTHTVIYNGKLKRLESKAKKYDMLMKQLKNQRYIGSPLGDSMLGMAASVVPGCGYSGVATVLPFAVGAFFINAGLPIEINDVVDALPSRQKLEQMVTSNAIDSVLLAMDSMNEAHVYLSSDKGNKKGNKNLAKFVCWYDTKDERVKTFLLDVDCTEEETCEIAEAVQHALKKVFRDTLTKKLRGQCTDSGGGGTLHALARELKARDKRR